MLIAALLACLGLALPATAPAAPFPPPEPIVGTWQFDGAMINVVGSAGVYYGALVSGSYGGCGSALSPGDVSWKSLSGTGLGYSGRFTWYYTDDCRPAGDGPLTITLSSPDAGVVSSSSPVDSGSFNTAITRVDKPLAWMSLNFADLFRRPPSALPAVERKLQPASGEPYSDAYYEIVWDEQGMPHFVPSKSHSGASNCTCVDGATLVAYVAMLSAGTESVQRLLGRGASCGPKTLALLRAEVATSEQAIALGLAGTTKKVRAKLAAKISATIPKRQALAACLKRSGYSDTVTAADVETAATIMQSGSIPAELSGALRFVGASAEGIDLLRLQFFTAQTQAARGKFPASLARPKDLQALRRFATALRG